MNETAAAIGNSSSSVMADATSTFTALHLVLIALLALLVIVGIVYGARLKHRRDAAEHAVEEHAIEAGVAPTDPEPPAEPSFAAVPAPAPAVPAPAPAPAPVVLPPVADVPSLTTAPEALADGAITAAPQASAVAEAASADPADGSITQLKGLGPKVAARLGELGITTVGQIASLDEAAAASLDARLGAFAGRMGRDRWIEQARFLAAGDRAGFEAVFGRL